MINKKWLLAILLITFASTFIKAQNNLYVNQSAQSQVVYSLSSISRILTQESALLIKTTAGVSDTYTYSNLISLTFSATTSSEFISDKSDLILFPNPAVETIYINGLNSSHSDLKIYNISGGLVYSQKVNSSELQISVESLVPGLYLVRVNNKTIKFSKK